MSTRLLELSLEEEWPRLRAQLELEGSWLAFVLCSSPEQAADLLERTSSQLAVAARHVAVVPAADPSTVDALVSRLLEGAPEKSLTWVTGVAVGQARRLGSAAWEQALLRANDHRDALLRRHPGGLVLCLPAELKPLIRETAPDLWAKRVLAVEVAPPFLVRPEPEPQSHADVPGSVEDVAVAEPLDPRRAQGGQRTASRDVSRARALLAAGDHAAAAGTLTSLLRSDVPPAVRAQALVELAHAHQAAGDLPAAIRAVEEALTTGGLTSGQLERAFEQLRSLAADDGRPELAVAAARGLAALQRAGDRPAQLAATLNDLSSSLGQVGRRDEGLAAIEEAVEMYRRPVQPNAAAHLPELANSLNNLSNSLGEVGRRKEALAVSEEAVGVYRRLAEANPAPYLPDLATSLNNLSVHRGEAGRREEGLAAVEEAVEVYRRLAEAHPAAYLPDLATSLNNLSMRLGEVGRREEALAAIEEAVRLILPMLEQAPYLLPDAGERLGRRYLEASQDAGQEPDADILARLASLPQSPIDDVRPDEASNW